MKKKEEEKKEKKRHTLRLFVLFAVFLLVSISIAIFAMVVTPPTVHVRDLATGVGFEGQKVVLIDVKVYEKPVAVTPYIEKAWGLPAGRYHYAFVLADARENLPHVYVFTASMRDLLINTEVEVEGFVHYTDGGEIYILAEDIEVV